MLLYNVYELRLGISQLNNTQKKDAHISLDYFEAMPYVLRSLHTYAQRTLNAVF